MKIYRNTPDEMTEDKVLRRVFSDSVIRKIDKEKRQIEFIISTDAVDRYRDIIEVDGWDLKNYKRNPVVLFGHNSSIPPIGKAVKTWKEEGVLKSIAEFMPQDISAFAHSIFRMYEEKFLRAVSVGFRALKWEWIKNDDGEETGGIRFLKSELLEFSAVPVPANPEALIAARHKGIDTAPFKSWAEEMLDKWNETADPLAKLYGVGRKDMENIRRRAAGAGTTFIVPPDVQDNLMKKNLETIRAAKAAKMKEKTFKSVVVRGIEIELPVINKDDCKNAGTVTVSQEEINGEKTLTIEKADAISLFTPELLEMDDPHFKIESRSNEDEEEELVMVIDADNWVIEYDLIGVTEDGTFLGMKGSETEVVKDESETPEDEKADEEDVEDVEDKAKKPADDEDDDKSSDDEDDDEDDDKSADDNDDEDDDEKSAEVEVDKQLDEEKEISLATHLLVMENNMCNFEETLDKSASPDRMEQRRMFFLAGYMRELADRLDGGKKGSSTKSSEPVKVKEEQEEGMTPEEATDYVKSISENLQPLLTKLITEKVNRLKGRLD